MRRAALLIALVLVAALLWRLWPGGGGSARVAGTAAGPGTAEITGSPRRELRIEIRETAEQSAARQREILARYADDPRARAWVADCMAQGGTAARDSWEYACWRAWGDREAAAER